MGLIVAVALAVALWPRGDARDEVAGTAGQRPAVSGPELRTAAALVDCPQPAPGAPAAGPLSGVRLACLTDGRVTELAAALSGKPALLNLWAYWCAPCATELPHLQEYADRAGDAITVLTVHSDPEESKALARLVDLNAELRKKGREPVRLPGVQDSSAEVQTLVEAPKVLPISVLVRADGSIAKVVVRPFTSVADISDTVARELGVVA